MSGDVAGVLSDVHGTAGREGGRDGEALHGKDGCFEGLHAWCIDAVLAWVSGLLDINRPLICWLCSGFVDICCFSFLLYLLTRIPASSLESKQSIAVA